jgi:hypothetical protein
VSNHEIEVKPKIITREAPQKKQIENTDPVFTKSSTQHLSTAEEKRNRMARFGGQVVAAASDEKATAAPLIKSGKKVKCKHFPKCNKSDEECPFIHPSEQCKYFPACTNGEKCIYLHPEIECKFAMSCNRQNCAYKHPKGH